MKNLIKIDDSIFVAGHNGMVGSAIVRCLLKKGYCDPQKGGQLLIPEKKNLDLLNFDKVLSWFREYRPKIVILQLRKLEE